MGLDTIDLLTLLLTYGRALLPSSAPVSPLTGAWRVAAVPKLRVPGAQYRCAELWIIFG